MSPLKQSNNFAARMGRWSANHWKTAVLAWLAFVIAAVVIGGAVGTRNLEETDTNVGEARKADKLVAAGFPADKDKQSEIVLIQSDRYTASDPEFRAVVREVENTLEQFPKVEELESPLDSANRDQISADGRSAMVTFSPEGDYDHAITYIQTIEAAVDRIAKQHEDDFYVDELGSASSGRALDEAFAGMLATAGLVAIPLALVILLFVFGSVVAAFVPLLLAITAVIATTALVALPSQLIPVDETISEVILLIGLAVGVDYSLFYLRREREERAAGRGERAALEAAAATSGRAVLISGVTVMIAMAGMFFAQDKTFTGFAIGTMMVVAVAMIGSLTVLPALLAKLGDRVEKGRIPFVHRLRKNGESRVWAAILDRVLRRPVVSALAAAALLVALTVPAFSLNNASTSLDDISIAEVEPLKKFEDAFPGGNEPAVVAVAADDVRSAEVRGAVEALVRHADADRQMGSPIEVQVSADNRVVQIDIPLLGKGTDQVSKDALRTLREEIVPQTVGQIDGVEYAVGGFTAADVDWTENMKTTAPIVFAFVLVFAFALLLVSFRSIVIALKAIVLNLLSVGAAYGILVATFQWGWGESVLDFESNGGITPWLPMFLFVILFGLSMDYHVFILSRVREAFDRGLETEDAIAHGIKSTAGVVTSAAVVMVATFSVFAILPLIDMKEMGVGLAAAVLIDATIIRAVLLPATMKLLGEANWYLPNWLQWLPRLEHEPAPETPALPKAA